MKEKILITGASGLLGRALVQLFLEKECTVYAQYHSTPPPALTAVPDCHWLPADFSSLAGIRDFLDKNAGIFSGCKYLVNNYGPMIYKDIESLESEDYLTDFFHNVIPAVEITGFFIRRAPLVSVVNVGFEFAGEIKPYRNILSYAAAKNALLLITRSFAARFKDIRFHMVCPPTMEGAQVKAKKGRMVSPQQVAQEIYRLLMC